MTDDRALAPLDGAWLRGASEIWRRQGRNVWASFAGSSMSPTILAGEEVLLECGVDVGVGDVALVMLDDGIAVHRVLARSSDGHWILTAGDANLLPDQPLYGVDRVVARIRCKRLGAEPRPLASPPRRALKRVLGQLSARLFRFSPRLALRALAAVRALLRGIRGGRGAATAPPDTVGEPTGRNEPDAGTRPPP